MADRMPPPGMTVIGAPPMEDAPKKSGRMPPPGMQDKPEGDVKASAEEAEVIRADEHCLDCKNYDPTSGDCAKVSGSFDPQDACAEFFEKIGSDEPEDDAGDIDDQEMAA